MLIDNLEFMEATSCEIQGGSFLNSYYGHRPQGPHPNYKPNYKPNFLHNGYRPAVDVDVNVYNLIVNQVGVAVAVGGKEVFASSLNNLNLGDKKGI